MSNKVEQAANVLTKAGAAVAITPFFTIEWWNDHSAAVVAICAVVGAIVTVASFVLGQIYSRRKGGTGRGK